MPTKPLCAPSAIGSIANDEDNPTAYSVLHELENSRQLIRRVAGKSAFLPLVLQTLDDCQSFDVEALLDSWASGCYVDGGHVRARSVNTRPLPRPIPVYNANSSSHGAGHIRYTVDLSINVDGHSEVATFAVTNTDKSPVIVGYDWLRKLNPSVDWRTGKVVFNRFPAACYLHTPQLEDAFLLRYCHSWKRVIDYGLQRSPRVSLQYLNGFSQVFEKIEFDRLPEHRQRDHAIKLKPGIEPLSSKIYPFESLGTSGVGHVLRRTPSYRTSPPSHPPLFYYY
ncbi:hypothetical protein M404DRAFT_172559 [Pisolithus tinctorius Marx 270]|uniref:Uncharacterized protein n=1 Tax=Pisolithus tinctorius Marx 270 TaxID=870435 RepID=A0A0C3I6I7_PISTI|nr:hypothetical protein M404DRAFT_172559 [Pisolithus tinctorius Marx 270]